MNCWKSLLLALYLALSTLTAIPPAFCQQTGSVIIDLKPYTSETRMPKKSQKSLEHAGIRWGMMDNTMLFSLVDERYVNIPSTHLTRYGNHETLEMKPGQYTISCIGYEFNSISSNLDKQLAKAAFFNNDALSFTVEAGKTITIAITSSYVKESAWRALSKFNLFLPNLSVQVIEDGKPVGDPVVITQRTSKSIAWDDYHGPSEIRSLKSAVEPGAGCPWSRF